MIQIDLTGRRALVTGASSGLGRAIALSLGAAGARVGVHYLADRSAAEAVVSEMSQAAGSSAAFGADVGDLSQVERMFADVWGHPDSLRDLDEKIAMARPGEPEEIGRVAAFLVSDLASYITGTTLAVDGGMLIYPDFSHGG